MKARSKYALVIVDDLTRDAYRNEVFKQASQGESGNGLLRRYVTMVCLVRCEDIVSRISTGN